MMTIEERRVTDVPLGETSRILAIMYTVGYFATIFTLMWRGIPEANKDAINMLLGALTTIQTGIVAFYFGGSRANERAQVMAENSKVRTDATLLAATQVIPAAVAAVVTPAGSVTPGPVTPGGIIPAAEVVKQEEPLKG